MLSLSPTVARRLAITSQRLAGPRPESIMAVLQAIRCLQVDPIRAVDYTQHLVLWSRLGNFNPADLAYHLWKERSLFEYWAHAASIVLIEDYPIFQAHMRWLVAGNRRKKTLQWLEENKPLRPHILSRLEEDGPLSSKEIKEIEGIEQIDSRWFNRNVPIMLDSLLAEGVVMVAGREGRTRLWDLTERCLPEWTPQVEISKVEASKRGAEHALRALGVARRKHINLHFMRNKYQNLPQVLEELEATGRIIPVEIVGDGERWPDTWYIHVDRLLDLEAIQTGDWQPRTTLLSPFDNLICDRDRTEELFDFYFRIEIYVPRAQRQFGYYVLPILHGDQLVGRISPKVDRTRTVLEIDGVFAEDGQDRKVPARFVQHAIQELADYLGAKKIVYTDDAEIPAGWRREWGSE